MKRRELLTTMVASGLAVPAFAAHQHDHEQVSGPLANVTVSFGAWPQVGDGTNPPDRFTTPLALPAPNVHALIPYEAKVKAGGAVNFIVAGFHLIAVYAPGTELANINVSLLTPNSSPPGLIDDPTNRVYRGIDPRSTLVGNPPVRVPTPQDRVEVVQFPQPGRYLVICAVVPHFVPPGNAHPPMHGWVTAVP